MTKIKLTHQERYDLLSFLNPHTSLYSINPWALTSQEHILVQGDCDSDACEELCEALEWDETDRFNECVADGVKEGKTPEEAYEAEVGGDNQWLFVNGGSTIVSLSDWHYHKASKAAFAFARAWIEATNDYENSDDDRGHPTRDEAFHGLPGLSAEEIVLMLRWFFNDATAKADEDVYEREKLIKEVQWHVNHEDLTAAQITIMENTVKRLKA